MLKQNPKKINIVIALVILLISAKIKIYAADPLADDIIYFVMIDRFADGDKTNNLNTDKNNPRAFHGGDIPGIISKIDYLKKLGITAILLSPFFDNRDNEFFGGYGFHGYWIKDFYKVDEHFGNTEDLKRLAQICRQNNIKLIIDIVMNHTEWNSPLVEQKPDWFNKTGDIKNWNNQTELENNKMGGLPDFNQDNPEVYQYLLNMTKYWIKITGCDGIRLDAVKHIPKSFWSKYCADIKAWSKNNGKKNFVIIGEVLQGDPYYIKEYFNAGIPALFDFPLYFKIRETIGQGGNAGLLASAIKARSIYPAAASLVTFIDNHDVPRFLSSANGSAEKLKLALAFIFTMRGTPAIYYGTESLLSGKDENEGRTDMIFDRNKEMSDYLRNLIFIRKISDAVKWGKFIEIYKDNTALGYQLISESEEALIFFNNSSEKKILDVNPITESGFALGAEIKDLLNNRKAVRDSSGKMRISLEPYDFQIFIKKYNSPILKNFLLSNINTSKQTKTIFKVIHDKTEYGQQLFVVGSLPELGEWNPEKAAGPFDCPNWPEWKFELDLPPNTSAEYKFIIKGNNNVIWESGDNRTLSTDKSVITVNTKWKQE